MYLLWNFYLLLFMTMTIRKDIALVFLSRSAWMSLAGKSGMIIKVEFTINKESYKMKKTSMPKTGKRLQITNLMKATTKDLIKYLSLLLQS